MSQPTAASVYLEAIQRQAVPTLSLMDREPFSITLGCMDRTYWAWKFTDFPGARFQEGLCVLSFLYATPFAGNDYYQQPKLGQWLAHGFDYWVSIQYADGAFDEAYPYERSLAATAFTSFYLSEAWHFLQGKLPPQTAANVPNALKKAGDWLIKNDETHGFLSNHLAAAAAALYHIYKISGDGRYEARSRYFIDKILSHQSSEGWYDEYGGADPGYQTHGSFYLARCWQLSRDSRLLDSLKRSFTFLAHFIHPDGSLGGEYASRNTQTYYPAAFEMMSGISGAACWTAETMLPSVTSLAAAGLGTVDSYNYFPLLNNYVFAYLACQQPDHRQAPPEAPPPGTHHFPQAGLLKVWHPRYEVYIALTKGGVLKAFDRQTGQLIYNDCGYMGRLKNGRFLSTQWIEKARHIEIKDNVITVDGNFYQISKTVFRPFTFIGFRGFNFTIGRLPQISYWLKSLLVKVLIYRKKHLDLRFQRQISLQPDKIKVTDHIQGRIGDQIDTLKWVDVFTTIHMGSSKYFTPNELRFADIQSDHDVERGQLASGVTLERTVMIPEV